MFNFLSLPKSYKNCRAYPLSAVSDTYNMFLLYIFFFFAVMRILRYYNVFKPQGKVMGINQQPQFVPYYCRFPLKELNISYLLQSVFNHAVNIFFFVSYKFLSIYNGSDGKFIRFAFSPRTTAAQGLPRFYYTLLYVNACSAVAHLRDIT